MARFRFSLLLPILFVVITSALWLSARAQYRAYLCPAAGVCPPNGWTGWTDYTPPSIQAAGMLNLPVAIFAHPLYHLMQGTVRKRELVALLIGVAALWSYIGWRIDTRGAAPRPTTTLRTFAVILGCVFALIVLIEAISMFHAGILYKFVAICWAVLIFRHFVLLLRTSPALPKRTDIGWHLPRITLVSVAASWAVILIIGALALPPLDSSGTPNATTAHVFAVCGACLLLLMLTIYAVVAYLMTAWRNIVSVPNRSSYVVWIGFETGLAVVAVAAMIYLVLHR